MKTCVRAFLNYRIPPKTHPTEKFTWEWDAELLVSKPYPAADLRIWINEQLAAGHTHYIRVEVGP